MPALHRIDLKAEVEGVELAYDPQPEIHVWVARMNNPAMLAWQNSPEGKERLRVLKLTLSREEAVDRWFRENVAMHVVRRWSGMTSRGSSIELPYSHEASIDFMVDPRFYEWQDWVAQRARETERFVEDEKDEASKNSPPA